MHISRTLLSCPVWCGTHLTHLAMSSALNSFVTGGEDGYVRLHHFDMDYFTTKFF